MSSSNYLLGRSEDLNTTILTKYARYISELSPSAFRGRLVTISALFITGGQVIAYVVGWLLSSYHGGWRWMVGLGAIPAIIQMSCLGVMPETPRWLVKAEQPEKALIVLRKIYGTGASAESIATSIIREIQREMIEESEIVAVNQSTTLSPRYNAKFAQLISVESNYRALLIACLLQGSQQLCGFVSCDKLRSFKLKIMDTDTMTQNSLMYYSATIFALIGFQSPTLAALSVAVTNFLFTLVAFAAIDRIGRRRVLLSSIPLMAFGLSIAALSFSKMELSNNQGQDGTGPEALYGMWPHIVLAAMVIYVAGYAVGLGCVPWQQSE